MTPHFLLRCLGRPELLALGGEPVRLRSRKHVALLTFLAVEGREPHRRDRLADLLWPDAKLKEGRQSLATALWAIRGKLGPRTFDTTRETVRLIAANLEVDLDRLARGDVLGDETTPPLLVEGFLEEFVLPRAPDYMMWRDLARARWLPKIRAALVLLMDRCRRTGDFSRIGPHADRLLAIDGLSEEGIRSKMEACAFEGDRITAIRIFQEWRQRLAEELGAAPSALIERMALRLRQRGYEPPGAAGVPTVSTDQYRNRIFVGRTSQYQALYERWEETSLGRGRHALLLGDSGVGKTTLAERLTTAAGLEGAVSSRVQCYDVEREIPYMAMGAIVRGLIERPGASGTAPEWLAELALNIPAVAQRYPNLPPARESTGENARLRFTEAMHELASAVAHEQPVILVVDDVHMADDASVAVLHHLMRRTQDQRIMIILTAQQADLGNSPHAGRLMSNRDALALGAVELPPLTDEEMHEVISALATTAEASMPAAVRRALLRAAAGVPLLVELLFDDWRANGADCLALSVGAMTADAQGRKQRDMYHRVLDRTFRMLSPEAQAVLNLAAILGERLNDHTMYQLVDLSLARTLAGTVELEQHRILRDGDGKMEFRNELLRGYAYLCVPSPLRRALHGLIADRLLVEDGEDARVPGLTLAWHCFRAGRPLEAEPYLLRGSRESLQKGGTFEVELGLTSAMQGLSGSNREEAEVLLVEALQQQGRHAEAVTRLECLGPVHVTPAHHLEALRILSCANLASTTAEAESVLESLDRLLETNPPAAARVCAIQSAFRAIYILSDRDRAVKYITAIRSCENGLETPDDCLRASLSLALCSWLARRRDTLRYHVESGAQLERALLSAGTTNLLALEGNIILGASHAAWGDYESALRYALASFEMAKKLGNDGKLGTACLNLAMSYGRLGFYSQQIQFAEQGLRLLPKDRFDSRHASAHYYLAMGLYMSGENHRASDEAEHLKTQALVGLAPWAAQGIPLMGADVLFAVGERERAIELARDCLQASNRRPETYAYAGMVARWLAVTAISNGEAAGAHQVLGELTRDLASYDLMDQAEILCGRLLLERKSPESWPEGKLLLAETLSRLPGPVEDQLRRLGMLD